MAIQGFDPFICEKKLYYPLQTNDTRATMAYIKPTGYRFIIYAYFWKYRGTVHGWKSTVALLSYK